MPPPLANVFQPLINVFDAILKVFHDDIGLGWGLAIIALTVLIRSLLLPLTLKQLRSMHRIAQFTPEIKKLREKHGSDPQRLQQETMAFYKKNRVNPLGSVLPAVAQLPVFLSLYYMLRIELRYDICPSVNPAGTSNPQPCGETTASQFLFIPDLTSRATGAVLVALIALYVGSQLFSFLLSANPRWTRRNGRSSSRCPSSSSPSPGSCPPACSCTASPRTRGRSSRARSCASAWAICATRRRTRRRPPADAAGWLISSNRCAARTRASHRLRAERCASAATRRRRS